MAKWVSKSGELSLKIAIIGQPGSGKKEIIRSVVEQYNQSALRTVMVSDAEVISSEFILPEPLPDGPFVRVGLKAVSGNPTHQAADQLVLSQCDALVFVVSCDPSQVKECKATLSNLIQNAANIDLNWNEAILVVQYNKAEQYPSTTREDLDSWLGVNVDEVKRYHTKSNSPEQQRLAVDAAIRSLVSKLGRPSADKTAQI